VTWIGEKSAIVTVGICTIIHGSNLGKNRLRTNISRMHKCTYKEALTVGILGRNILGMSIITHSVFMFNRGDQTSYGGNVLID